MAMTLLINCLQFEFPDFSLIPKTHVHNIEQLINAILPMLQRLQRQADHWVSQGSHVAGEIKA